MSHRIWTKKETPKKSGWQKNESTSYDKLGSDKDLVVYFPKIFCDKLSKCYIISCLTPSVNDRLLYHSGRQVGGWRVEGGGVCYLIKGRFPPTLRWFRGISYLIRAPQVPWALLLSQLLHCLQFQPSDWGLEGGGDLETRSTREGKKFLNHFLFSIHDLLTLTLVTKGLHIFSTVFPI